MDKQVQLYQPSQSGHLRQSIKRPYLTSKSSEDTPSYNIPPSRDEERASVIDDQLVIALLSGNNVDQNSSSALIDAVFKPLFTSLIEFYKLKPDDPNWPDVYRVRGLFNSQLYHKYKRSSTTFLEFARKQYEIPPPGKYIPRNGPSRIAIDAPPNRNSRSINERVRALVDEVLNVAMLLEREIESGGFDNQFTNQTQLRITLSMEEYMLGLEGSSRLFVSGIQRLIGRDCWGYYKDMSSEMLEDASDASGPQKSWQRRAD
ncbi:MAG: hypothetical protein Q9195_006843 [Heterodermia aff. obscurata]